jgi:hypothetical protein
LSNYESKIIILNTAIFGDQAGWTCTANPKAARFPHFECTKIVKATLFVFLKLFVFTGMSDVIFNITGISTRI